MRRLVRIGSLDGVALYVHWSTFAAAALALLLAPWRPGLTLVFLLSLLGMMLLHEWGHVAVARQRRCVPHAIELYPLFGVTRYSRPWSRWDDALIAWGGVAAQCAVAVPLVFAASRQGFGGPELLNAAVAVFGHFSLVVAAFNLLPVKPLDGARAWQVVPVLWRAVAAGRSADPGHDRRRLPRKPGWPTSE